MQMCVIFSIFVDYQSLHQNWTHMYSTLATFFDIFEIKITDEDSDPWLKTDIISDYFTDSGLESMVQLLKLTSG